MNTYNAKFDIYKNNKEEVDALFLTKLKSVIPHTVIDKLAIGLTCLFIPAYGANYMSADKRYQVSIRTDWAYLSYSVTINGIIYGGSFMLDGIVDMEHHAIITFQRLISEAVLTGVKTDG